MDQTGYDELFANWTRMLESDPVTSCERVELRNIRSVGARQFREYDEWPIREYDRPAPADEASGFKPPCIAPDYADAHVFVAMILSQIPGRREDAISECERALKLRPGFAVAHRQLERLRGR